MFTTIRQQIVALLIEGEYSARDLSQALSITEREAYAHLEHVEKSVRSSGRKFLVLPARCQDCDFTFADRRRLSKPGKCPQCRGSHIRAPHFSIR